MSLIKSISGIRGTIGGAPDDNLTPIDAVKFAAAYGTWLKKHIYKNRVKVVVGRDALVGVVLFLSLLVEKGITVSALRRSYPAYFMSKNKIQLTSGLNPDKVLLAMQEKYAHEQITTIDGLKIDFPFSWVHLRKSNTEPIIRIYTEAKSQAEADALATRFMEEMAAIS